MMEEYIGFGALPVVIALTEAVKQLFPELDKRFHAPIAMALGITWSMATAYVYNQPLTEAALAGVILGLASVGLFSGLKNTFQK